MTAHTASSGRAKRQRCDAAVRCEALSASAPTKLRSATKSVAPGVAGQLSNSPGSIGYIELAYAVQNDIAYAAMQNKAGEYVLPSADSVRAAAAQKPSVSPSDFSITNMDGKDSYPISAYSWLMVWKNQADPARGKQLTDMLKWLVTGGQQYAAKVNYVPLPDNVQQEALKAIASIHS